jgi:hypothetical protein
MEWLPAKGRWLRSQGVRVIRDENGREMTVVYGQAEEVADEDVPRPTRSAVGGSINPVTGEREGR